MARCLIIRMVNKSGSIARPPSHEHSGSPDHAPRTRRGRGRPTAANAEDVREKLLDAARELFPRYGYRAVSSRQLGAAAGVNFDMTRYYFGGQPGRYTEMLHGVMQPARASVDAMSASEVPIELGDVLANITRSWAGNPW